MSAKTVHAGAPFRTAGVVEFPPPTRLDGAEGDAPPIAGPESAIDILVKILTEPREDGATSFEGPWQEVFLQAIAKVPVAAVAARVAGVPRSQAFEERRSNPDFAERWDNAFEEGVDAVEAAAFLSAVYGDRKPVFYKGRLKGWSVAYSHATRSMLLKSWRKDIFGQPVAAAQKPKTSIWKPMTLDEYRQYVEEGKRAGRSE